MSHLHDGMKRKLRILFMKSEGSLQINEKGMQVIWAWKTYENILTKYNGSYK